ncbi:unnamed protein product, partial [marine sediment metagenome]
EGDIRKLPGGIGAALVSELSLDATASPDAVSLQHPSELGALQVATDIGDANADGLFERLYAFGARSVSIWSSDARLLWDSGDILEQATLAELPAVFNSEFSSATYDTRSDNRGPEPEGVAVGIIDGVRYAFVGLERTSAIVVFNLEKPTDPKLVTVYHGSRYPGDLVGMHGPAPSKDQAPEGILFIPADESASGKPLVIACFEVSGTTRVLEVR